MDLFIKELNKEAKSLTGLSEFVWQEWSENQTNYASEIRYLKQRLDRKWREMESDPDTEIEGGRIADRYAKEIEELEDEIKELEKKYSYSSNKKQITSLLKRFSNEILFLYL